MPITSIYLFDKDLLLLKKEIFRYFGKSVIDVDKLLKTRKLKTVSIEGKKYYRLGDILKVSTKFIKNKI